MPKARWNVGAEEIDDFDRESQYLPYSGPIPPSAVYLWQIKVLKHVAGTKEKHPQLRVGLELVPREDRDEEDFEGYFIMAFLPVTDKTAFRYVPFLDAIGVSGHEFANGTITDEEGNIRKIGRWKNTGEELVMAQLQDGSDQNGNSRKEIGIFMAADEGPEEDEFEEYDEEEEELDDMVPARREVKKSLRNRR